MVGREGTIPITPSGPMTLGYVEGSVSAALRGGLGRGECDATNPPMWANVFEKLPHWRSTLPVICWMPRLRCRDV